MIKIIAIIAMTCDHIGLLFFQNEFIYRAVGRLAFPLFAYQTAISCRKTKDIIKFQKRLLIFALISEIPYNLMMIGYSYTPNIIYTILIAVFVIWGYQEWGIKFLAISYLPILFISKYILYGTYGIFIIIIFYFFKNDFKGTLLFILATIIYYYEQPEYAFFATLSVFIFSEKTTSFIPKYFFYIYYPAHIILLIFIKI